MGSELFLYRENLHLTNHVNLRLLDTNKTPEKQMISVYLINVPVISTSTVKVSFMAKIKPCLKRTNDIVYVKDALLTNIIER